MRSSDRSAVPLGGVEAARWERKRDRALAPGEALRLLQEACVGLGWDVRHVHSVDLIKERPGRRLTVRYHLAVRQDGGPEREVHWFGKLYRGSKALRAFQGLRFLRAATPPAALSFPEPVGFSGRRRFLVLAPLPGSQLAKELRGQATVADPLRRLGSAIAVLHRIPVGSLFARHAALQEAELVARAYERIRAAGPSRPVLRTFERLARRVQSALVGGGAEVPDSASILHRDLHPGQVYVGGEGVGLLDLDDAALGEPELDLGNFVAHLALEDLQHRGRVCSAAGRAEVFMEAYGPGSPRAHRFAAYRGASLLRLASLERLAESSLSVLAWPELLRGLLDEVRSLPEEDLDSPHHRKGSTRSSPRPAGDRRRRKRPIAPG